MDGVLCSKSFIIGCKRFLCLDIYAYPNLSGDFEILLFQEVMYSTNIKYALRQQFKEVVPLQPQVSASQIICYHFPDDPWVHFCNGYFEVYSFFSD